MRAVNRSRILLSSAKARQINVNLKEEEYKDLISLGCMYCGVDLSATKGVSLDRVDSSKGYTSDNVVPCCRRCNVAKNDMDSSEFFDWIDRVYEFKNKKIQELKELSMSERDFKKETNKYHNTARVKNSKSLVLATEE